MKKLITFLLFFGIVQFSYSQSLDVSFESHSLEDITYVADFKSPVTPKSYFSLYAQHNTGSSFQGAYTSIQSYHNIKLSKDIIFSAGYQRLYFVDSKKSYNLANIKLSIKLF